MIFKAVFFGTDQISISFQQGLISVFFKLAETVVKFQTINDESGKIFLAALEFFKIPISHSSYNFNISLGGNFIDYKLFGNYSADSGQQRMILKIVNLKELGAGRSSLNFSEDELKEIDRSLCGPGLFLVIAPPFSCMERILYPLIVSLSNQRSVCVESRVYHRIPGVIQILHPEDEIERGELRRWLDKNPENVFLFDFFEKDYPPEVFDLAGERRLFLGINLFSAEQAINKLFSFFELRSDFFAQNLKLVLRGREIKHLCPLCKKPQLDIGELQHVLPADRIRGVQEEQGCPSCYFSGYFGRDQLLEVISIREERKPALMREVLESGFTLRPEKLLSLQEKALLKLQLGQISYKEFSQIF
jgi:hypothetical protein